MKNGVLFGPQEIGNLLIEVKCANVLSQSDKANSFWKEKTTDEMESGESDQSEALGVVLHSDRLNTHSMASVFVALLVETDMIVYKSRAKQLKRQQPASQCTPKSAMFGSHVLLCSRMSQARDGFSVPIGD